MKTLIMTLAFLPTLGSAYLNAIFYYSTGQTWWIGAGIAAAVVGCDIVKPLCFSTRLRHWLLTALLVACGLFLAGLSMNASISLTQSQLVTGENTAENAAARVAEIDAALVGLPTEPTTLAEVDMAQAAADREAARGGCGPKCEALKVTAAGLVKAKAGYERRVELEAERKSLAADANKADGETDLDAAARTSQLVGVGVELVSILAVVFAKLACAKIDAKPKPKPKRQPKAPRRAVTVKPEPTPRRRLTDQMVLEALDRFANGESRYDIAKDFSKRLGSPVAESTLRLKMNKASRSLGPRAVNE